MPRLFDTTLRDGEQTPGVSLKPEEKVWIARKLDNLGVDVIEAGSAVTSRGEKEGIKRVAGENLDAEICSYTRLLKEDIDAANQCNVDSIHLVVPVSDLHIEKKLGMSKREVLDKSSKLVGYAKELGLNVTFSGEDASRADMDFISKVFSIGVENGADKLCYCDTVGVLKPEKTKKDMKKLNNEFNTILSIHCHNDLGYAVPNTIEALRNGADEAHVTINGIGERAGNAALEEVVMSGRKLYDLQFKIDSELLYETSKLVSRLTGIPLPANKPIVGENAFTHESGIHAHGVLSDSSTYEPISPDEVGRERKFTLGKHTGKSSVKAILEDMDVEADREQIEEIVSRVKEIGDKGKTVTTADLQTIVETVLKIYKEAKVELKDLTVVSGNKATPTASVELEVEGKNILKSGTGTGPVDACIKAVREAISSTTNIELEDYRVEAITGGTDALVEVVVRLRKDENVVSARGARTDIIMASVEAMIEGVNRLMMEEE